ncbi:hypothetical protein TrRE_jg3204 [Triparma retinervis]|uniref:Uncharacterized protein n=1 Tax=Triparma retinervis TaxID=2557542 RepID=A0A9W7AF94_9STRA|nr:hypothetical protein TrRE_jg3204 [Triparma retinervis]
MRKEEEEIMGIAVQLEKVDKEGEENHILVTLDELKKSFVITNYDYIVGECNILTKANPTNFRDCYLARDTYAKYEKAGEKRVHKQPVVLARFVLGFQRLKENLEQGDKGKEAVLALGNFMRRVLYEVVLLCKEDFLKIKTIATDEDLYAGNRLNTSKTGEGKEGGEASWCQYRDPKEGNKAHDENPRNISGVRGDTEKRFLLIQLLVGLAILQLDEADVSFSHSEIHVVTTNCTGVPHVDAVRGFLPETLLRVCTDRDKVVSTAFIQIESVAYKRDLLLLEDQPGFVYVAVKLHSFDSEGSIPLGNPSSTFDELLSSCMVELLRVDLKKETTEKFLLPASEFYNGTEGKGFLKLGTLKMPSGGNDEGKRTGEEEACLLGSNKFLGVNSKMKTSKILPAVADFAKEIAGQAKRRIEERKREGTGGNPLEAWAEGLERVKMEKVFYIVDSSGAVEAEEERDVVYMEKNLKTGEMEERTIKAKVTKGANLKPQFFPHTNVKLNDNFNKEEVLFLRFFFVPERLQNTVSGSNSQELRELWGKWNRS